MTTPSSPVVKAICRPTFYHRRPCKIHDARLLIFRNFCRSIRGNDPQNPICPHNSSTDCRNFGLYPNGHRPSNYLHHVYSYLTHLLSKANFLQEKHLGRIYSKYEPLNFVVQSKQIIFSVASKSP